MNPPDLPTGWYWDFETENKQKDEYRRDTNIWIKAKKMNDPERSKCTYLVSLWPGCDINSAFGKAYRSVLEAVLSYPWGQDEEDPDVLLQNHLRAIKAARDAAHDH